MKLITKAVLYYRLSKPKKGKTSAETANDAHGINAQKAAVAAFFRNTGLPKVVGEFTEIETGTSKKKRPMLAAAVAMARAQKATLVIAKLDRLARNVLFVATLMESDVEFVIADNANATRLTLHILAAVAENEARDISNRTKDSLAVLRNKGFKMGAARPEHAKVLHKGKHWIGASKESAAVRSKKAKMAYEHILPKMREYRYEAQLEYDKARAENGRKGTQCPVYETVATRLNADGYTTTTGSPFSAATVWRILDRYQKVAV